MMKPTDKDVLLALPSDVINSILLTWLEPESLPRVDSAYCHHVRRPGLLAVFSSPNFVVPNLQRLTRLNDVDNINSVLGWIGQRSIRSENLIIGSRLELVKYFEKFGQHVKVLATIQNSNYMHSNSVRILGESLRYCTNLLSLDLCFVCITREVMEGLTYCRSLQVLCSDTSVTVDRALRDEQFDWSKYVGRLELTTLDISVLESFHCEVFLRLVKPTSLKNLQVKFSRGAPSVPMLAMLEKCKALEALSVLSDGTSVGDGLMRSLVYVCPQLQHLHVYGYDLTAAVASTIATLQQLKTLRLYNCNFVGEMLRHLAERGSDHLEELAIEENHRISGTASDMGLNALLSNCANLRRLRFPSQILFDPSLLCNITTLVVECNNHKSADEILRFIAPHCAKLQHLGVVYSYLSETDFGAVTAHTFPVLKQMDVYGSDYNILDADRLLPQRPAVSVRWNRKLEAQCQTPAFMHGLQHLFSAD